MPPPPRRDGAERECQEATLENGMDHQPSREEKSGRYRTRWLLKTSLTSPWDSFQDSRTRIYPNLSATLLFLFPPTVFHSFSSFLKNKPAEAVSIPYRL